MTTTLTAPAAAPITLQIHICDQRRSYKVTFTGPNAEDQALTFVTARSSTHAMDELEDTPVPDQYTRLLDWLYPTCEHGMKGACYGPQHYYMDDEERYYAGY